MLRFIFLGIFGFILIALLAWWVLDGGIQRVRDAIFAGSASTTPLELPWSFKGQVGVDLEKTYGLSPDGNSSSADLSDPEQDQEMLDRARETRVYGDPSPFFGDVRLMPDSYGPSSQSPESEYVAISASTNNTAPVPLSGWSLQSVLTGVRLYLPNAAPVFSLGNINEVAPVYLAPGEQAIISSSVSPVSVSFRENMCTGYLGQYQTFTPQLSRQCPSPQTELPMTPSNFAAYGDSCFDTLESLYACTFPDVLPQSVSPECAAALRNTLSYTSCVVRHRSDPGFNSSTWRLFLGSPVEVWRNSHDTIRLLDAQGRTVDVYSY